MSSTLTSRPYHAGSFSLRPQASLTSISMSDLPILEEEFLPDNLAQINNEHRKSLFSAYETMKRFEATASSMPGPSSTTTPVRNFGYGARRNTTTTAGQTSSASPRATAVIKPRSNSTSTAITASAIPRGSISSPLNPSRNRSASVASTSTATVPQKSNIATPGSASPTQKSPVLSGIPFPRNTNSQASPSKLVTPPPVDPVLALHRRIRAERSKSETHRSSLARFSSTTPEPEEKKRSHSPDIAAIIQTTPRPRRGSSASLLSSPQLRKLNTTGLKGSPLKTHSSLDSIDSPLSTQRLLYEQRLDEKVVGAVLTASPTKSKRIIVPDEYDMDEDDSSASDSDIDIHTPLPSLMVRHGLLSPKSKLLMRDELLEQESEDRPGSVFSVTSTKSVFRKDQRDTPMRRVRHRDGKTLRGGIGLTTGLGWSDSEDEDAPSALTKRISSLALNAKKQRQQEKRALSDSSVLVKVTPAPVSILPPSPPATHNASPNHNLLTISPPINRSTPLPVSFPIPPDFATPAEIQTVQIMTDTPISSTAPSPLSLTIPHHPTHFHFGFSASDSNSNSNSDEEVSSSPDVATFYHHEASQQLDDELKDDEKEKMAAMVPYFVPGLSARARSKMRRRQPAGPRAAVKF